MKITKHTRPRNNTFQPTGNNPGLGFGFSLIAPAAESCHYLKIPSRFVD